MYGIVLSDGEILWFNEIEDYIDALDQSGPEVVATHEPLRSSFDSPTACERIRYARWANGFDNRIYTN